jgi:hypothetical protein
MSRTLQGETTRTGANAEPLAATNSGSLRSTTGGQSSGLATTTAAGTRPTGQVSIDSTESDAGAQDPDTPFTGYDGSPAYYAMINLHI